LAEASPDVATGGVGAVASGIAAMTSPVVVSCWVLKRAPGFVRTSGDTAVGVGSVTVGSAVAVGIAVAAAVASAVESEAAAVGLASRSLFLPAGVQASRAMDRAATLRRAIHKRLYLFIFLSSSTQLSASCSRTLQHQRQVNGRFGGQCWT